MNGCLQKKYFSQSINWISLLKFAKLQQKNALGTSYCKLYHYATNNPIKYTDPDGRFSAIYKVNKIFNEDWKKNIEAYKKNMEINFKASLLGIKTIELTEPFEKTMDDNAERYLLLIYDWANYYAISLLGANDYSQEQIDYTNEELSLFQALQKCRTSKTSEGNYNTSLAENLMTEATEIWKAEYNNCKKEGLSNQECNKRAEQAGNKYLKEKLTELGYYE